MAVSIEELRGKDNKILFDTKKVLKAKDLKEGHVYLIKDGRVMVYLGQENNASYVFYVCGSLIYEYTNNNSMYTISNYDLQTEYMETLCNSLMKNDVYAESITVLKGIPTIYGEFTLVEYEKTWKEWYLKSYNKFKDSLPELSFINNAQPDAGFVKAGDLIPGHIYYAGDAWRNTWVYLGRSTEGKFVWYFVGNETALINEGFAHIIKSFHSLCRSDCFAVTKSNKKVKPLSNVSSDPTVDICRGFEELEEQNFTVNIDGLTQKMLDKIASTIEGTTY
jgi:hypothetical protein